MNRIHPLALAAVAACALAACGGSDGDTAPLNTLPAGVLMVTAGILLNMFGYIGMPRD